MEKGKHGGKREGAGRKKGPVKTQSEKSLSRNLSFTDSEWEKVKAKGGSKWIRSLLTISLFLSAMGASLGLTLTGGVEHNVDYARTEAFRDARLPYYEVTPSRYDLNYKENIGAIRGKIALNDRKLCAFKKGPLIVGYSVRYYNEPEKGYAYWSNGSLAKFDIAKGAELPAASQIYNSEMKLIQTAYYVGRDNQYIFDLDGKLDVHWVGNKGYNEQGKLVLKSNCSEI